MTRPIYDRDSGAMYVWFAPEGTKAVNRTEVAPGIRLDYDAAGNVIGIEVLDRRQFAPEQQVQAA